MYIDLNLMLMLWIGSLMLMALFLRLANVSKTLSHGGVRLTYLYTFICGPLFILACIICVVFTDYFQAKGLTDESGRD